MRLDFTVYSVVLAGSLGAAYWASMPPKESSEDDKPVVYDTTVSALQAIRYKTADGSTVLTKDKDGIWWGDVEATGKPEVAEHFLVNDSEFKTTLKQLNPLRAQRVLGVVKDDQLQEFGLKDSRVKLVLEGTSPDAALELICGKNSFGTKNQFVENAKTANIWVIDNGVLQALANAKTRLVERRIVLRSEEDLERVTIRNGARTKVITKTKSQDGSVRWSVDGDKAAADPKAKTQGWNTWMEKVLKMRSVQYASPEQVAALEKAAKVVDMQFEKGGQPQFHAEIRKIFEEKPMVSVNPLTHKPLTPTAKGEKTAAYWFTSDELKAWVSIPAQRFSGLEKDLTDLL